MQIWRWNLKNKQFSRHEIKELCNHLENHPYFKNEAKGTTIKITLLNIPFIHHFGSGPTVLNTFMCNDTEWRILFFNSTSKEIASGVNHKLYVEIVEGKVYNMDNWVRLHDFIYDHWNPGGVYAIEKWFFERT